jgi:hypothetical protein
MVLFILDLTYTGDEMPRHYDIPDPFQTFVAKKYANAKGAVYDFFAKEWHMKCGCCKEELFAPSRKILTKIRLFHTRNECLGGY